MPNLPPITLGQPTPRYYARQTAPDTFNVYERTPEGERFVAASPVFTDALAVVAGLNERYERQRTYFLAPPKTFHYRHGWLGGWFLFEGERYLGNATEEVYAAAIVNCLNWCSAIFSHLPIRLAGVTHKSVN